MPKFTIRSARQTIAPPNLPAILTLSSQRSSPRGVKPPAAAGGKTRGPRPKAALTFSVLLDPAEIGITTADWPQLSLATAVAVCDALAIELISTREQTGPYFVPPGHDARTHCNPQSEIRNPKFVLAIKWPNDVLLHGAKVCGILIESPAGSGPAKDRLIVGIGINVNNSVHALQPAAQTLTQLGMNTINATALHDVTNRTHDTQQLLCEVLCAMETRFLQLAANDPRLPGQWQRLCYQTQQNIIVEINGARIEGVCLGLDENGKLLVKSVSGTHRVTSGSVRLR